MRIWIQTPFLGVFAAWLSLLILTALSACAPDDEDADGRVNLIWVIYNALVHYPAGG